MVKKRNIIIFIGVILLALGIGFYNRELLKIYYYDFTDEQFKEGDSVYAYKYFVSDVGHLKIDLYRLAKSNSSSDMKMIETDRAFMSDSLYKYKSSFVGTMIKKKLVSLSDKRGNYIQKLYTVKPNLKALHIFPEKKSFLPAGYSYVDSNYYFRFALVTPKEENTFR